MLFYSNNASKKYNRIGINQILGLIQAECSEHFFYKICDDCNIGFIRDDTFFVPFMGREYWFILPRTESAFDQLILVWHKEVDKFCVERDYALTEAQAQVVNSMINSSFAPSMFGTIENLMEVESNATQQGIEKDSERMKELLHSAMLEVEKTELDRKWKMQEYKEKIKELEPPDSEKNYTYQFLRGIDPAKCRLQTLFPLPNIFIELLPYTEYLGNVEATNYCWAIQVHKKTSQLQLKTTRKSHKHNKALCYL